METTIYMVRHAESPFILGQERTRPLSNTGEMDANRITHIMKDLEIDHIVSSPYRRAIQTIEGIAQFKNKEIVIKEELKEKDLKGDYPLTEEELYRFIKKSFEDIDFCLPDGESVREVQDRALPVVIDLLQKYEGKSIILGTHGNVMTIIMNYFNSQYGYEFWESTSKPDIYKMVFSREKLLKVERLWD